MQKCSNNLSEGDRRLARKWGIFSVGFYGSILGGLILYAALNQNPDVNYASAEPASHVATNKAARPSF